MQKAIVIHPFIKSEKTSSARTNESKLEEAVGLAEAIFLKITETQIIGLPKILPGNFLGKGKIEELENKIEVDQVDLIIINEQLSPVQQRNLEKALKCKVIDRTALILEIFGERASTREGTLQVELAALEYQKSRLVRSWTHLERQRGGSGFMGGPGEKQIESDRRSLQEKITRIKKHLEKVVKTRTLHRKSRQKIPYPIVALIGYTNAGKSTLFNHLTGAKVMAKDMLFATLDPTMRLIKLPSGNKVILSDTVGFISDLPTELIAAFRATLEEVVEADIILHVRDISHSDTEEQKQDVIKVMSDLLEENKLDDITIEVLNKIDLLDKKDNESIFNKYQTKPNISAISAITEQGIEKLLKKVDDKLLSINVSYKTTVPTSNGKLIAWIHANAKIISQSQQDDFIEFEILISEQNLGKLKKLHSS